MKTDQSTLAQEFLNNSILVNCTTLINDLLAKNQQNWDLESDTWFQDLKNNKFTDKKTGEKIPDETIKLLQIQKDITVKQFIKYPKLYYTKSSFPLEISQRAFDHLWRICESYELWCKEAGRSEKIILKIID